ncbi:single-stranded-DNA-specific exonuclease RecJ [Candidatus Berkelbacteria bacterium CG1_02_42_45]|nr:MAG: single-stranded-DNA-specific exonuclease RecJ [Candidatus Berkelbacteria bacterium CG1_02_42_45]
MEKIWEVKEKKFTDPILQLLYNRGVIPACRQAGKDRTLKKTIEDFLQPDFAKDFHDPELLPDFKPAILRIKKAMDHKEKIGIFADYDADGIPGAALLYKTFRLFNITPEVYIPTRQAGYGFNQPGIDFLLEAGCKLIISVDLGIKEFELARYIASKDADLIITDHHLPEKEIPKALAVINPKISSSKYPFKELAGAGVVYKIIQGLAKIYPEKITESFLKWNLDLVAISTISDVVPLIDENRVVAKFGLLVLRKSRNLGIKAICEKAAINQAKINSYTVGFQIGPRINAPGRVGYATGSFKILVTEDTSEAKELAAHLEEQNACRQASMKRIFREASRVIEKEGVLKEKILLLSNPDWPKGVIGPVASSIVEKYFRPTILFRDENKILVGSGRSIGSFNIVKALEKVKKYTLSFGGHAGAAGVRVDKKNFTKFREAITKVVNESVSPKDLLPKINIDLELPKDKISIGLFRDLEKLEPFGMGNPRPIFTSNKLRLISHRYVGRENKHLQLRFALGTKEIKGIVFSSEIKDSIIHSGHEYDLVYNSGLNFWDGKWWLDLQIIDLKARGDNG